MESQDAPQTALRQGPSSGAHTAAIISQGHPGRVRYAEPRTLPSFPSKGLKDGGAAASAAASLGWASQKPLESWTPDKSASASAAAILAKDYKASPAWEPEPSSAGSKAAMLAAGSVAKTESPRTAHSGWGNSAANRAFRADRNANMSPQPASPRAMDSQPSMRAAMGAMSGTRPRSTSSPLARTPAADNPTRELSHALNAATLAHRPKSTAPVEEAGAIPYVHMPRQMFTAKPPVQPEMDEQKKKDILHASAVAMAKRMFNQQQKSIDQTKQAYDATSRQELSHGRSSNPGLSDEPGKYTNLQDVAYKLAQNRLTKLHEEHQRNREYQEYYGSSSASQSRFSMKGKLRRRSSSDGELKDLEQSATIRQKMSIFSTKLSQVDEKKRTQDREAVLAAAQRNVKARLQGMDEKVYQETGKVNPTLLTSWEIKAHSAAKARIEARMDNNRGKVDVGGGKFMERAAIDEIATKKVQPVLDEINEKAEVERERQAAFRMEEEAKKREEDFRKERDREEKEIHRKLREQQKEEERQRKQEEKHRCKEEDKAAKAQHRLLGKEDTQKTRDGHSEPLHGDQEDERQVAAQADPAPNTPTSPNNESFSDGAGENHDSNGRAAKARSWIKAKLSRPHGKPRPEETEANEGERGFVGGAALTGAGISGKNASVSSLNNRSSSMREVAMAGRGQQESEPSGSRSDQPSPFSSVSDLTDSGDKYADAEEGLAKGGLSPPRPIRDPMTKKSSSPSRDSRFRENLD